MRNTRSFEYGKDRFNLMIYIANLYFHIKLSQVVAGM